MTPFDKSLLISQELICASLLETLVTLGRLWFGKEVQQTQADSP